MLHAIIMQHNIRKLTLPSEHDPLRPGIPVLRAIVKLTVAQQWELIVRTSVSQGQAAVIPEGVRVLAVADRDVALEQLVCELQGLEFMRARLEGTGWRGGAGCLERYLPAEAALLHLASVGMGPDGAVQARCEYFTFHGECCFCCDARSLRTKRTTYRVAAAAGKQACCSLVVWIYFIQAA